MRRIAIVVTMVVSGALGALPALAQSAFTFGVLAGAALSTGTFGSGYKSGFAVGGDADYWLAPSFALGMDVLWSQHDADVANTTGQATVTLVPVGGHLKVGFGSEDAMVTPWVDVGAGAYNISARESDVFGSTETRDTRFGMNVGAGIDFRTTPTFSIGAAGAFHVIPDALESDTGTNAASYFTLGLRVSVTTAGASTVGGRPY